MQVIKSISNFQDLAKIIQLQVMTWICRLRNCLELLFLVIQTAAGFWPETLHLSNRETWVLSHPQVHFNACIFHSYRIGTATCILHPSCWSWSFCWKGIELWGQKLWRRNPGSYKHIEAGILPERKEAIGSGSSPNIVYAFPLKRLVN